MEKLYRLTRQLSLLITAFLFLSTTLSAQTTGDFQSRQGGNWNDENTWQRYDGAAWQNAGVGEIPLATSPVQIQANHTVLVDISTAVCNNLTIDANGHLNSGSGTSNQLSVYGDLTNNGNLNFYSGSDATTLEFAGTGNAVFSCGSNNTNIYEIEINKDVLASTVQLTSTANFLVQGQNASAPQFLTLTTGTFRLSGSFTMSSEVFIDDASPTFAADEGFWLDNPNFTIQGQDGEMEFNGFCRISDGIFNLGNTLPQRFYMNNSSEFIIEGGTLNLTGSFYSGNNDPITYNQSGGTINTGLLTPTERLFLIDNANADFTMSGGTINLVQENTSGRDYQVDSDEAHTHITGGTLNVGTAATATDFEFEIQGKMPNVIIDNTTNNKTAVARGNAYVYGDFTVKTGALFTTQRTLTANVNRNFYFYGNIIANGDFDGFNEDSGYESRLFARFRGTTNATITGTGAICDFYDLRVNKGTDMTAELDIQRAITINEADSNDGNRLYVENGTLKFSGTETINSTPYFGGQNINSTTGRYWMANPNLTINWANVGSATSLGEFIIDAGTFNAGNTFLINGSSTANNQMNGGTINVVLDFDMEQDLLMTAGTINVTRDFIVDANGADEYGDLTITNGNITAGRRLFISGKLEIDAGSITIGDGNDYMRIYEGGTLQLDGGDIIINGYTEIRENATANNQINGGTLRVSGNFDMEQNVLISNGTLTVNTNFYMDGDGDNETGDLTVTGGTLNVGDGNNIFRAYGNGEDNGLGGSFTMSNGTVNVYGRVEFQNGTGTEVTSFTMTGGNFNIDPQHSAILANNTELFYISDNSLVNFTGGTLTFLNPHADKSHVYRDAIEIRGHTGAKNFEGSTIAFGDGTENKTGDDLFPGFAIYDVSGEVHLYNIILNNPTGTNREFIGRNNTHIFCHNLTLQTANDKYVMTGKNLEISGDFINNGELDGTTDTYTDNHLLFTGTTAQTYSGSGFLTTNLAELTFNNTSATGVSLSADIGAEIVNLTSGNVYTNASPNGLLTVFGTATTDLVGGSATNQVIPYLRRAIPNTASTDTYLFPVGSATNYRLLELQNLTTAGTGSGFITTNVSEPQNPTISGTAGSGMATPLLLKDIYWKVTSDLSSVTIPTSPKVKLTYDATGVPPYCITQSNNDINGTYNSIGRLLGTGVITSETFDLTSNGGIVPSGDAFIGIGQIQPIIGTLTVGATGDVLNLTAVADTLSKNFVQDDVYFELLADYDDDTETIPINFNSLMLVEPDDYVVIRPQLGVAGSETAQAGTSSSMITIDNIHHLYFDGRPGSVGTTDWTLSNIDATAGSVFEFKNDAYENKLSYLTIQSDIQSNTNGVVLFGLTDQTNGNDNNLIEYCDITGRSTTPTIGIYSAGTSAKANSQNTIDNCNIYDFFTATEDPKAIFLDANNENWTLSNNKIYQTSTKVFTEDQIYYGIHLNSGNSHIINGNTIGYAESNNTGTTTIDASSNSTLSRFCGIWANVGSTTATTIESNTVSNISFTTNFNAGTECGVFSGIFAENGDVNIGSLGNGNTIGSSTVTNSITIQHENNGYSYGIKSFSNDVVSIDYNAIGGITVHGLATDDILYFRGIFTRYGDNYSITNNTLGSLSTANSIQIGQSGITIRTSLLAIYNYENTAVTISNNTIANLTNYGENGNSRLNGIYSREGSNTINNNEIYNLTSFGTREGSGSDPDIIGIRRTSYRENQEIAGNEIYGLINNRDDGGGDAANPNIVGIAYYSCETQSENISRNFIHNFGSHATNEDAIYTGIYISGADKANFPDQITNNMIQLGYNENGNSINQPLRMYGINYKIDAPVNFYHNSIYIGGTATDPEGTTSIDSTFCIYKGKTSLSTMKNNIFVNERSNSLVASDGRHYTMDLSYNEVVTTDYNIYNVNTTANSGGILARLDGNELIDLRSIQAYADNGNDLHSGFGSPNFTTPNGDNSTTNLHLTGTSPAEGMATNLAFITTDFDGQTRSGLTPNDIGADAGNFTFDASVDIYTPYFAYTPFEPQTCGTTSAAINVTITDQGTGFPESGAQMPRVFYRDKDNNWNTCTNLAGTFVSQTSTNNVFTSEWTFTLTGLNNNIFYEYYFVAEDRSTYTSPNIGYSKFDDNSPVHSNVNTATTYPDNDVNIDVFTVCVFPAASYTVGNDADCNTVLGTACDFKTLTSAQDFFYNMNSMLINKDVTAYIVGNTTEPATVAIEQTTEDVADAGYSGPYTISVESYDQTAKTLTCLAASDANMIRFEGGDNYRIDGQYYNTGVADGNSWLSFIHEDNDQSVFTFKDDAQNNSLQYLTIKVSNILVPYGVIFIDSTTIVTPNGNTNILIDHNTITKNTGNPSYNVIYSYGGGGATNSNISITNNVISEFQNIGIWATSHSNNNWTISDNTIFNSFIGNDLEAVIKIESGSGYTINNNKIGGSDINLGGSAMENDYRDELNIIYLDCDNISTSNITNNTIKNISCSEAGTGDYMRGIYSVNGKANITGNTLENFSNNRDNRTYAIFYTATSGVSISNNTISNFTTNGNGDLRMFYINTDVADVNTFQANVMKNMTVNNTGGNVDFYGLYLENGRTIIADNILGGNAVSDKITHSGGDDFRGFYVRDASGSFFDQAITNNQILNIEITANDIFRGFYITNTDDGVDINLTNNTVDNLNLNCNSNVDAFYIGDGKFNATNNTVGTATYGVNNSGTAQMRVFYFSTNDTDAALENNIITNISNNGITYGIYHDDWRRQSISGNLIHGISIANDISFTAIHSTSGNPLSIQNNVIQDITMTNGGSNTYFTGIRVSNGNMNIGTTTGNLIGHETNANSIVIDGVSAIGFDIANTGSTSTVSSNTVSNMTATGANTFVKAFAISNTGGIVNFSNNIAKKLNANGTGNSYVSGISIENDGNKNISGNTIFDISTASTKTDISDGILASQGIWISGNDDVSINSNTLYNISASGTANTNVSGISENATNATITKNKIYAISNTSSGSGTASGITLFNLNTGYVANNIISLGENDATQYSGIFVPQTGSGSKQVFFNSIYIEGNSTGGNSYAFLRKNNATPLNLKNNIFSNFRTGSGKHYAIANENTSDWTSLTYANANNYYSINPSTTGLWGATDNNFETWLLNSGEDGEYRSTDEEPLFADAPNGNLHLNDLTKACFLNAVGEVFASVTDDFDGNLRDATNPDIGAFEFTPTGRTGKFVWRGFTDNDWGTATNWQCGYTPSNPETELLVIPDVTNDLLIDEGVTLVANEMNIRANGFLTINPNNSLTLNGNLTNSGTLLLKSPTNSGANGSFIDNGTINYLGTGKVQVERFIPRVEWHYVSIPTTQESSTLFTTSPNGWNPNFLRYNESYDSDDSNDWGNYVEAWQHAHGGDGSPETIYPGEGFANYDNGYKTIVAQGEVNNADLDVNIYATNNDIVAKDGWNLIGNPFTAALDWNDASWDKTNIDNTLYYWSVEGGVGRYRYYNGAGGTQADDVEPLTLNGGSQFIPTMQGFFVHATSDATFTFPTAARVHSTQTFWKSNSKSAHTNLLKINIEKDGLTDETALRFLSGVNSEFDGDFDAYKMIADKIPQIYTRTEQELDLAINSLPFFSKYLTVPLGCNLAEDGSYSINILELTRDNIPTDVQIYLEDKVNDKMINIEEEKSYDFTSKKGTINERFVIHFMKFGEVEENLGVQVYSNESKVIVRILLEEQDFEGKIEIFNLLGALISTKVVKNERFITIPVKEQGIYIVNSIVNGERVTKKVFIK